MKAFSKKTPHEIYLEWVTDWLTVQQMADNYNMDKEDLLMLIEQGKEIHTESTKTITIGELESRKEIPRL